jgi:hypothetical protein
MDKERIAKMADNIADEVVLNEPVVAQADDDDALVLIDQALDSMIAAAQIIDENLPKVKTEGVPQKAAVDAIKDTMDTGVKPYIADVVKAMSVFGE